MLWFYWLRETDACERLRRVEEDKRRSADEEKKTRFSDRWHLKIRICVCSLYGLMLRTRLLQLVQVHQETVDLYLEDIILDTLENTTDQQAREDIHRRAQEVNNLALTMEER